MTNQPDIHGDHHTATSGTAVDGTAVDIAGNSRAGSRPMYAIQAQGAAAASQGELITDVLFDFGGVLSVWDPRAVLIGRYDDAAIDRFLDNAVSGFRDACDMRDGGITAGEATEWMRRTHGEPWASMYTYYSRHFVDSLVGCVPGARRLIEDLRVAGIGAWGLSNWARDDFEVAKPLFPAFALLRDYVVSGYEGVCKPSAAIYELAISRFGIDRAHAVFVDDKQANVDAANSVGLRAIHFGGDHRALRRTLVAAGVPIPHGDAQPGDPVQ